MQWRYQMWEIKALQHDSNWINKSMGSQACQLATKRLYKKTHKNDTKWIPCHFNKMKQNEIMAGGSWVSHTNKKRRLVHQDISQN